jgi:hypothetical protein
VSSNLGAILDLIEALCHEPELWGRSIVIIEQGAIARVAFDAINGTINSIAKLQYFSDCKSRTCREIAKEQ